MYYNNSDDNSFMEYDSQEASSSLSAFMHSCRCERHMSIPMTVVVKHHSCHTPQGALTCVITAL